MATEIYNRRTLAVTLFLGSQQDINKGMPQLAKLFPDNVEADEAGWMFKNVNHKFFEQLRKAFKEDKVKFTEDFELNVSFYLGWVSAKGYTNLKLSHEEPDHHFASAPWEWAGHKAELKVTTDESRNDS